MNIGPFSRRGFLAGGTGLLVGGRAMSQTLAQPTAAAMVAPTARAPLFDQTNSKALSP